MLLLLACASPPSDSSGEPDSRPADTGEPTDSGDTADTADTADSADTAVPLEADLRFDGTAAPPPILGLGGQVWAGDSAWTSALDPLAPRLVRIALNANLGSSAVTLPTGATPEEWDTWFDAHMLDAAPTFLADLEHSRDLTDARGIDWIAHQWEAPPAWETGSHALRADRVEDFAHETGAMLQWLADRGVQPRWYELTNEPDGDWNTYIAPEDYDALVLTLRADLDARGLVDIGLVGPGLAVLGGWDGSPEWVPALSDAAVVALEAWSVHAWDDYAEAGDGHRFLEGRWQIFTDQVLARDPAKPILVTELGSKDTVFGAGTYLSPDPTTCGAASESDGYAIRILAHTAVALAYGADGLSYWEAADPSWACSRWGMVDTAGTPRRFHEALATFASAIPADGGVVLPEAADLPAVALVGEDAAAVLVVNDTPDRVTRTVAVTGGWSLSEARGFATTDRVLRDELYDLAQTASASPSIGVDSTNGGYFDYDLDRAYRSAAGDASLVWSPGGELDSASIVAWSWTGAEPVSVRVESSVDGAAWVPAAVAETVTTAGWYRHDLAVSPFPAGTRHLRVTLPAEGAPAWNPQLGDLTLRWHLDTPAVLPSGDAPWTLDLPPDSAVVLRLQR